ncbi:hypothetical protein GAY33_28355 [Azospirillum brasilense]|uniref:hypothetical protein n=1 Tax=Azospirillum argentinense TaxID=2970906 RepID=UPI00190E778E|nr:hypothetical protein [Azospirillum argentinense]MBK3803061.1 hypothetical protein [Azospirillum argentinense]
MNAGLEKEVVMSRFLKILAIGAAPILLAGCTTQLSSEDRAMLQQAQADARDAKAEAARATAAAQAASTAARTANDKADRILAAAAERKAR